MGNDSFIEDVSHSAASGGHPAAQPENPDGENEADNDADLNIEAEPAMEQPVRLESFKTVTPEGPNQEPILRS
jgi:hypothetical protein